MKMQPISVPGKIMASFDLQMKADVLPNQGVTTLCNKCIYLYNTV